MDPVVISIVSLCVAASSLGWNVSLYLLGGARPKVHLVVGAVSDVGLTTWPLGTDIRARVAELREQDMDPVQVIGVRVVNHGRLPMRVDRWSIIGVGGGAVITPFGHATTGPQLPHALPAGANETWTLQYSEIDAAITTSLEALGKSTKDLRVVVETGTGKRLTTKERHPVQQDRSA